MAIRENEVCIPGHKFDLFLFIRFIVLVLFWYVFYIAKHVLM